ncbi:AzlD domain-containing protein [Chroogloeocystis siderophila]|uniref:Branched-chain amino acid transporter n=1 Tax=Chroogloeocystis siderophila 5.2 s.c.1 TaxID=247279 RepID=A0A1U7HRU4_9CHRO|nr:AzlD domain-containing protein [Chroogloeocystis siderophila]OKH26268.1 branched-chain amino acid transporter [Chroogloeocystis siderophila 5.2 s.c.1]
MNIWIIILLAGLGTYLMRSVGIWATKPIQSPWLHHIPFAVILVMAISGIIDLSQTPQTTKSAIAATVIVITASVFQLPLVLRIVLGCLVFGAIA